MRGESRWFNFLDLVSGDCRRMIAHARKNWCSKLLTFILNLKHKVPPQAGDVPWRHSPSGLPTPSLRFHTRENSDVRWPPRPDARMKYPEDVPSQTVGDEIVSSSWQLFTRV